MTNKITYEAVENQDDCSTVSKEIPSISFREADALDKKRTPDWQENLAICPMDTLRYGREYALRFKDEYGCPNVQGNFDFIAASPAIMQGWRDERAKCEAKDALLRECLPYVIDGQLADAGAALYASNMGLESKQSHSTNAKKGKDLIQKLKAALAIENSESCSIDSVKCEANNTCESEG